MADANDLSKVPNFEAVETWLQKLHDWCEGAAQATEGTATLASQVAELEQENSNLTFHAEQFDSLAELVFDVDRGVRDISEVIDWLKGRGFEA